MRQSSFEQRVRRAEFGDYSAFNMFLMIATGIELAVFLLWSLVYLGNLSIFVNAVILAGAAGASGGIIGFLLGIPKAAGQSVRNDRPAPPAGTSAPTRRYENSTALEEISEWLTKIIVGVGLVEFSTIVEKFELLSQRAAPLFIATGLAPEALVTITSAILLTNFLLGFSAAYIFTRMFLVSAFFQVDAANQDLLARNVERISEIGSASLFHDDGSPDDRRSAVELLKVPISSLRTREDFLGWAKAHIIFNDYASAAEALRRALDAARWKDPELLSLYARTLAAQDNSADARKYFDMALSLAKREDPARLPDIIADQIDGALVSGQRSDLDRGHELLTQVPEADRNSPRLLALRVALRAQEAALAGEAEGENAKVQQLAQDAVEAIGMLKASPDERSQHLLNRLRRGLDGRDGLFRPLIHFANNDAIRNALKGKTEP